MSRRILYYASQFPSIKKLSLLRAARKPPKIIKYTGFGVGCLSTALVVQSYDLNILPMVGGGIRFLRSLKIGLTISLDYYFSTIGLNENSPNYKPMMSIIHQRAASRILEGCLLNGGCYIKLGQGLVSMSHILPKEYVDTLKSLQDKCLIREPDELVQLFKEDFGKHPCEIFKDFYMEPIAAASIAQVFVATTKEDQKVAVKVQYIDLQSRFNSDVKTVNFLLTLIGFMHPNFNFDWVLEDLEATLREELNFINEGRNSEHCAYDLQHFKYVYVPKVLWDCTSTRVLVTEFIDGNRIDNVNELKKQGYCLSDLNTKLCEIFGYQIFQTGFVHADPHPGNILVRRVRGKPQLVLLDHGLYQSMTENERVALSHMWKAIVLNDHNEMQKYSKELGVQDYQMFAEILTQSPLKTHGFKLRSKLSEQDLQHMTEFAQNKFDNIMICLKSMPRNLLLVIRNLNTIRAISHEHGNPIDRYSILARMATKSIFEENSGRFLKIYSKFYFETNLLIRRITLWFKMQILNVLYVMGIGPNINELMASINVS